MLFWWHIALGPPLPPTQGRASLLVRAFLSTVAAVKENLRAPEWALLGRRLAAPNYPASSPPPPKSNISAAEADTPAPAAAPPPFTAATNANNTRPIPTPRNSRRNSATDKIRNHRAPVSFLQPSTQCSMPLNNRDHHILNVGVRFDFIIVILKLLVGRQDQPAPHPEHQVPTISEKGRFFHQCLPRQKQRPSQETSGYPVTSWP